MNIGRSNEGSKPSARATVKTLNSRKDYSEWYKGANKHEANNHTIERDGAKWKLTIKENSKKPVLKKKREMVGKEKKAKSGGMSLEEAKAYLKKRNSETIFGRSPQQIAQMQGISRLR